MDIKAKVIIFSLFILLLMCVGCNKGQNDENINSEQNSVTFENNIKDRMSNIYEQMNLLVHADVTYAEYNENISDYFNKIPLKTFNAFLSNFKVLMDDTDNSLTSANEITDENIDLIKSSLAKLETEGEFIRSIAYRISNITTNDNNYNVVLHLEVTTVSKFGSYTDNLYYMMVFTSLDDTLLITHCSSLSNFEELYSDKNEYYFDDELKE